MFKKYASYRFLFLSSVLCTMLFIMVIVLASVPVVYAQSTIIVNSAADNITPDDNNCTLREAINNVNTVGVDTTDGDCALGTGLGDTISFAPSLNGGDIIINTSTSEDNNVEGDFDIEMDAIIQGNGIANTIINGGGLDRVFHVQDGNTVTFRNLTIRNGVPSAVGGGILVDNNSTVIIEYCQVSNNTALPAGGGLYVTNGAAATVNNSVFLENSASNGGAIGVYPATVVTIRNTLFSGNQAGRGGGLFVDGSIFPTILNINNSTFSGNNGSNDGGSIYLDDSANLATTIRNNTFANNSSVDGSVFWIGTIGGSGVDVQNSILHNNTGSNSCSGQAFTTNSNNLIDDTTCDAVPISISVTNFDTTLRENGGPTQTHALLPGSNAIDTGTGNCLDHTGAALVADQRGETRPIDYDRDNTATCDIGAFERQADETFTDTVNDGDAVTFGATLSTIVDNSSGTAPGQVTVTRHNQAPGGMPAGNEEMPFQVSIVAATPTGLDIDLTLCYTDWEIAQGGASIVESNLSLWRWNTGTSSWDNVGADTVDTVNKCVTKNNVSALSSWTLASGTPTAITFNGISGNGSSPLLTNVSMLLILLILVTGVILFLRRRPQ